MTRKGIAPLEFVLVLPLIFTLIVVTWHAAQVGFVRAGIATDAREKAWVKRAECDPGVAFDPKQEPLVSYVGQRAEKVVPRASPITGKFITAKTKTGVTDKTHDHEQFEFPPLKAPGGREAGPNRVAVIRPHVKLIEHFGEFIPEITRLDGRVDGFKAMDPRVNGRLSAFVPEALQFRAERKVAFATMTRNVLPMLKAAMELAKMAARVAYYAPPLAAWYLYEASVILRGVPSVAWLVTRAETR